MKTRFASLLLLLVPMSLLAQEAIPTEKAVSGARMANLALGKIENPPVAIDPDVEHAQGVGAKGVGALVVPDKGFSPDKIGSLGEKPLPLGQIWMLNVGPSQGGAAPGREKLRNVEVRGDDQTFKVQVYLLAVGKSAEGKPELLVYGAEAEPLGRFALSPASVNFQSMPLELTAAREGDESGRLTLYISGQHSAEIPVVKLPE
jgi:hypothetical protein